jgi:flagellar motility protein MotE (MotC chaperone)
MIFGVLLVASGGYLHWGDLPLAAAEDPKSPGPSQEKASSDTTKERKAKADALGLGDGSIAAKSNDVEEDEESGGSRRSFLDDLLYLPEISTDSAKKQELVQYLTLVERKKEQIEARISLLKKREGLLQELEHSIDKKITKLEEEMAYFQNTQQKEKQIQKERLGQLVEFYKKMSPKQAAPVFESLDKDLVVALWKEFPQKQTMSILALMNPQKAVELSEYFGRLRSAKEYELLKEINVALKKEFDECKGMPRPPAPPQEVVADPTPPAQQ